MIKMYKSIMEISDSYDALLFDLDGTLINSMDVYRNSWNASLSEFNTSVEDEFLQSLAGSEESEIAAQIIKKYKINASVDYILEINKKYLETHLLQGTKKIIPIVEVLKANYGKKLIALGTGSHYDLAIELLNHFDLMHFFDNIVTSSDVVLGKPDPEVWKQSLDKFQVPANKCLVFEDGDLGIKGALELGMDAIHVKKNQYFQSVEEHKKALQKENICLY